MYRVLFLFDYHDLHGFMVEAIARLRQRIPEMRTVSDAVLERVWMKRHLDRLHFIMFHFEADDLLVRKIDLEFFEDPPLHFSMYRMFSMALIPNSHPCIASFAKLRMSRTSVTLEFTVLAD